MCIPSSLLGIFVLESHAASHQSIFSPNTSDWFLAPTYMPFLVRYSHGLFSLSRPRIKRRGAPSCCRPTDLYLVESQSVFSFERCFSVFSMKCPRAQFFFSIKK